MKILLLILLLTLSGYGWQTTFEAEDASKIVKAAIETEHSGFTGDGYVNFDNEPGGYIIWNINMLEDSVQTLSFVFANGGNDSRQMELMINDTVIYDSLDFEPTGAWTNWDTLVVESRLGIGINSVQLTGVSFSGGPNIDKMIISGLTGPSLYRLFLDGIGGTISADPQKDYYEQDSVVVLTGLPEEGYIFSNWLGDLQGDTNPASVVMDKDKSVTAVFEYQEDSSVIIVNDSIVGFASLDGGTNGGAGGDTVYINDPQMLADIMKDRDGEIATPIVLLVSGTITGYIDEMIPVKRTGNISFIGISDTARFLGSGINLRETNNVIIKNITFADCPDDAINVETSSNIWIDHCSFTDSPSIDPGGSNHDGLLDVKKGSYNVTISYNHFMNHRKTALLGHSVSETGDSTMKVTYFANWFDGTQSRHPRTRYGKVHVLNNLYTNIGGYGVGVTCAAQVLLEGNYFENTGYPVLISQVNDFSTLSGDPEGYLKAVSNITINSGDIVENLSGFDFDPGEYYTYEAIDSHRVKSRVVASAGAGKIAMTSTISQQTKIYPGGFSLEQNYPNPFNPMTKIRYNLAISSKVILRVYDVHGREIKTLVNKRQAAGNYEINFSGENLTSGIYFYQLRTSIFTKTKKMILIK